MDERDEVLRLDYIQRRKIAMHLSRDQAIEAQEKQAHANKLNAKAMKIESHKRMEERAENIKEEVAKKHMIHDKVAE